MCFTHVLTVLQANPYCCVARLGGVCVSVCGKEVGVYSWRKPVTAWIKPPPQLIQVVVVHWSYTDVHGCVFF